MCVGCTSEDVRFVNGSENVRPTATRQQISTDDKVKLDFDADFLSSLADSRRGWGFAWVDSTTGNTVNLYGLAQQQNLILLVGQNDGGALSVCFHLLFHSVQRHHSSPHSTSPNVAASPSLRVCSSK